jgi:lipoprotein-anchoring transpeptidase ErfK/SrfK
MATHRARLRPRYGRIAALAAAVVVTSVSMVGGVGLLSSVAQTSHPAASSQAALDTAAVLEVPRTSLSAPAGPSVPARTKTQDGRGGDPSGQVDVRGGDRTALPPDSGTGRRIVFSETAQRVWLVDGDGTVRRTYLVSGSLTDNLHPGSYEVYSKSRWAVGVDDSGVMQYYVRFAHGPNSTIGFHTIPTHFGKALQSVDDLGTPQSHGCIRQRTSDAIALWNFAPVGTHVVVV